MAEQLDITLKKFAPGFWPRVIVMYISGWIAVLLAIPFIQFGVKVGSGLLVVLLLCFAIFGWALVTLPFGKRPQTDVSLRREGIVLNGGLRVLHPLYAINRKEDQLVLHWSDVDRITRREYRRKVTYHLRIREDRAWKIVSNLLARSVPIRLWQSEISEDRLLAALAHFLGLNGLEMTLHRHGVARQLLHGVTKEWTIAPTPPPP